MRILVTGGAGFIGSCYVREMLAGSYPGYADAQVTVVDKLTYAGRRDNLPAAHPRLTFVQADICDADALRAVLPGHDAVVHFAAESHVDRSVAGARPFVVTNVLGTQTLLDACLATGVGRVVHVSTDEVYGSIETGSWTEAEPLAPNSPYAASKAASDLLARAYWRTHGLNVSITRCANNYGPHQFTEKVIPLFVTNLLDGLDVPLYGDGRNVREWLHVTDHCRAIQLVLESGGAGEVYNIGSGSALTNVELTAKLLELCGAGPERIRRVPDRLAHDLRYSVDDTKIRTQLGYAPQVPFAEGLADVVRWYRDNRDWWQPLTERVPAGAGR
ncbi:MAG TPA: dTDP-glucose 4,6-dehydratase [Rugosimonospora sp.]|nr:dTDP-glucose 4,6-dehydratase [Rugosimonospora sp.]